MKIQTQRERNGKKRNVVEFSFLEYFMMSDLVCTIFLHCFSVSLFSTKCSEQIYALMRYIDG